MESYAQLSVARKSGDEAMHDNGQALGVTVRSFWQWSASDLVNNALRGRLAEFLVAHASGSRMACASSGMPTTYRPRQA